MNIYAKTPRRSKILISPVWNKILKMWYRLFELIQIEVQCSKNYFKIFLIFLTQETGAFGNNIEKESQKSRPKLKKYVCYIVTENICSACNPMQMVVFLPLFNFLEQRLKFFRFEGGIIPLKVFCKVMVLNFSQSCLGNIHWEVWNLRIINFIKQIYLTLF